MDQATRRFWAHETSPGRAVKRHTNTVPVGHELGPEVLLGLSANTAADEGRGVVKDDPQDSFGSSNIGRRVFVVQAE